MQRILILLVLVFAVFAATRGRPGIWFIPDDFGAASRVLTPSLEPAAYSDINTNPFVIPIATGWGFPSTDASNVRITTDQDTQTLPTLPRTYITSGVWTVSIPPYTAEWNTNYVTSQAAHDAEYSGIYGDSNGRTRGERDLRIQIRSAQSKLYTVSFIHILQATENSFGVIYGTSGLYFNASWSVNAPPAGQGGVAKCWVLYQLDGQGDNGSTQPKSLPSVANTQLLENYFNPTTGAIANPAVLYPGNTGLINGDFGGRFTSRKAAAWYYLYQSDTSFDFIFQFYTDASVTGQAAGSGYSYFFRDPLTHDVSSNSGVNNNKPGSWIPFANFTSFGSPSGWSNIRAAQYLFSPYLSETDFTLFAAATWSQIIDGFAYVDCNTNGIFDNGEAGICFSNGLQVSLYDSTSPSAPIVSSVYPHYVTGGNPVTAGDNNSPVCDQGYFSFGLLQVEVPQRTFYVCVPLTLPGFQLITTGEPAGQTGSTSLVTNRYCKTVTVNQYQDGTQSPIFRYTTAAAISVPPPTSVSCTVPLTPGINPPNPLGTATTSGGCGGGVISYTDAPHGVCGSFVRTWYLDNNPAITVQTITVTDGVPPTIAVPPLGSQTGTPTCGDIGQAGPVAPGTNSIVGTATASDNCGVTALTFQAVPVSAGPWNNCIKSFSRVWTATDACNSVGTATQYINYKDTQPPTITPPSGVVTQWSCNSINQIPAQVASASGNDACQGTPTFSQNSFSSAQLISNGCSSTFARVFTATDGCNPVSASIVITVTDDAPPSFKGTPNTQISCTVNANGDLNSIDIPTIRGSLSVDDPCGSGANIVQVSSTPSNLTPYCGKFTRTYTAKDGCNNVASTSFTVTVQDNQGPTFTSSSLSPSISCVDLKVGVNPAPSRTPGTNDNCNSVPTVTFKDSGFLSDLPANQRCSGSITRTWTAQDACGNPQQAVLNDYIFLKDGSGPILTWNPPSNSQIDVECLTKSTPTPPTATDLNNCNAVSYPATSFNDVAQPGTPGVPVGVCGTVIRTWTMQDSCGNTAQIQQTIRNTDSQPPNIQGAFTSPITVSCPDSVATSLATFTVTATDNCITTGPVPLTFKDQFLSAGGKSSTLVDNSILSPPDPKGTTGHLNPCDDIYILRTWTANDNCGRNANLVQTIFYQDITNPTIQNTLGVTPEQTCGQLNFDSQDDYDIFRGLYKSGDSCDTNPEVDFDVTDDSDPTDDCLVVKLLTWTVTDECGNSGTSTAVRTYRDNEDPVLTVADDDVDYTCDDLPNTVVQSSDDCSGIDDTGVTYDDTQDPWPPAPGNGCGITNIRTWYATDNCGNTATVTQIQNYDDSDGPTITLARSSFTIDCTVDDNPDDDAELTSTADASYDDECNPLTGGEGEPLVTVTFDPVLRFGGVETDFADCDRAYIRTFYAYDACDNLSTVTQTVFVSAPDMTLTNAAPRNVSCSNDAVLNFVNQLEGDPTFDDYVNAGNSVANDCYSSAYLSFSVSDNSPNTFQCTYQLTRTWTVTDPCGTSDSVNNILTIVDDETPTITFVPENTFLECNVETYPTIQFDDDCGPQNSLVSVGTQSLTWSEDGCSQAFARAWTVDDQCTTVPGNTVQTAIAVFTFVDTLPPSFLQQLTTVDPVECDELVASPVLDIFPDLNEPGYPGIFQPTPFDTCNGSPFVSNGDSPFQLNDPCDDYFIRTYTVDDGCTEPVSQAQTIWVRDNRRPTIYTDYTTVELACTTPPEDFPPIVPENREAITIGDDCQVDLDNTAITYADVAYGTAQSCDRGTVRTFYAEDGCGNQAVNVLVTFKLTDDVDPSFSSFPGPVTVECSVFRNSRDPAQNPTLGTAIATDNCEDVYGPIASPTYYDSVFSTVNICPEQVQVQRTWVATDFCQRTFASVQTIYLTVENPPVITAPAPALIDCSSASESTLPEFTNGYATITSDCIPQDRLPVPTYVDGPVDDSDPCAISFVRTWYAIDLCNNPAIPKDQTITIVDEDPPSFSIFPDTYYSECNNASRDPRVTGYPVAIDDCTFPVCDLTYRDFQTFQESEDGCPADILIYRTWIATDNCGLFIQDTQIIQIGVVPDGGLCPPGLCAPEECEACECPAPTSCDCCSAGGITACTPVPCLQVACAPVPCVAVDCTPCAIDTSNASGPAPLCGPEIACIPNIVPIFVDDGDGINDTTYPYGQDSLSDRVDYWVNRADYWRDLLINGGIDFSASSSLSVSALFLLVAIPLGVFGLFA